MRILFLILLIFFTHQLYSQDTIIKNAKNKRKNILFISEGVSYSVTLIGLNSLWYKDYPRRDFHFINDNQEWLQMDKIGHMTSSYYMGVAGIKAYKWAGINEKKAIWYGGLSGSFFLTAVEILDGFSAQWGASSGDLLANTLGSALCISQGLYWNEQKIQLKYSYTKSIWVNENPAQLGENFLQNMLKDYNGQTYWASFNIKSLLQLDEDFPNWLSFSVGYSGDGMQNPYHETGDSERMREYFLALDIDLNRIQTKSKIVNSVLHTFGFVKFPMPTLGYREGKISLHPLFF